MVAMASTGSNLPGRFVLGRLSHAERIGIAYEALPAEGEGIRARALVLHPQHAEGLRPWFERYALVMRGLSHPNLLYVHAIGYTDTNLPVVITEWIEGRSVRAELDQGRIFQPVEVLRVLSQVVSAVDYLHERPSPVLHRALQPEMVVLSGRELRVKLLGVAESDRPVFPPGRTGYLSPEELEGKGLSAASDVFSLASLAYELFTGRPAFPENAAALLHTLRRNGLPFLGLAPSDVLAPLDLVLHRAWQLDPARRHERVGYFFQDLLAALERVPHAEVARRRTYLDSPFRARSQPGIAIEARPVGVGIRGNTLPPPGGPAQAVTAPAPTRTGQFPSVRVGPTPRAVPMVTATAVVAQPVAPRADLRSSPTQSPAAVTDSGSYRPPRGQRPPVLTPAIPLVPKAPRLPAEFSELSAPFLLRVPTSTPHEVTPAQGTPLPPALGPGDDDAVGPDAPAAPPSVRPASRRPSEPIFVETTDAEIAVNDDAVVDDPEVSMAVMADLDLPLPESLSARAFFGQALSSQRPASYNEPSLEWVPPKGDTPLSNAPSDAPTDDPSERPTQVKKRNAIAGYSADDDEAAPVGHRPRVDTRPAPALSSFFGSAASTLENTPSALFEHPDRPNSVVPAPIPRAVRPDTQGALRALGGYNASPLAQDNTPSGLFEHPDRPVDPTEPSLRPRVSTQPAVRSLAALRAQGQLVGREAELPSPSAIVPVGASDTTLATFTPTEEGRPSHETVVTGPRRASDRPPSNRPPGPGVALGVRARAVAPPGARASFEQWAPEPDEMSEAARRLSGRPDGRGPEIRLNARQLAVFLVAQMLLTVLLVVLLKRFL
ncbi:MAG: protein kinase [Myxococcales bacterium]|nr:protein kinase [Myxococcales bacterium]